MEYTKLGNTDITVSKICVGCMSFGKAGTMHDWTLDETATESVVRHALDLGINFLDTANGYSAGTERLTARYSVWEQITWISTSSIALTMKHLLRRLWKR